MTLTDPCHCFAYRPLPRSEEFVYHREYRFRAKGDHQFGANYVIRLTPDSATYVDINTKLELKRPGAEDRALLKDIIAVPERVTVRKRHLNESDVERQRKAIRGVLADDEELMAQALSRYAVGGFLGATHTCMVQERQGVCRRRGGRRGGAGGGAVTGVGYGQ